MVLIAVVAASVSLAINPLGSSAKQINQQGEQLFAQMQFALDDALVRNKALGIAIEESEDPDQPIQYYWMRYQGIDKDTNQIEWIKAEAPLGDIELKEGLEFSFEIEEESLEESLDSLLQEDDQKISPSVVFSPDGEVTEFVVMITLNQESLELKPEAIGERYKILLDERGQLTRYEVGQEEL